MTETPHAPTPPEDQISLTQKSAYAVGMLVNNLQAAALPALMVILNLGLKMDARWVGVIAFVPRIFDAVSDPMMGYISDNTKSRWGRRRPYIFGGALIAGLIFALMWQLPPGHSQTFYFWTFLTASVLYFLAYTVYATPFVAFGFEMTSDYHERTRLHAFANTVGQLPWLAVPWFYWLMSSDLFADQVQGARVLAIYVGAAICGLGIVPAIFCRERAAAPPDAEHHAEEANASFWSHTKDFFIGLVASFSCRPFVKLCAATFLVFNGYQLGVAFTIYVLQFYIYNGDAEVAGKLYGTYFTTVSACTLVVIPLTGWIATRLGKRETFVVAISLSMIGYALKWFCYSPDHPYWLLASCPFIAFGTGSLFTLMASMVSDVCDFDELQSHERREGVFAAIYWWMVKVGMALAGLLVGFFLHAAGFNVESTAPQSTETMFWLRVIDVGIPFITSGLAIWIMATYTITEEKAGDVRRQLEQRRANS